MMVCDRIWPHVWSPGIAFLHDTDLCSTIASSNNDTLLLLKTYVYV